jgi:hypothetical protein
MDFQTKVYKKILFKNINEENSIVRCAKVLQKIMDNSFQQTKS